MIMAGYSAYSRLLDWAAFRAIADEVGALLVVDTAHIIGLIAGGAHPDPVPHAHVVTGTTHKALRGPRGGLILCKQEFAEAIDKGVFPNTQGGALNNQIAGKGGLLRRGGHPGLPGVRRPGRRATPPPWPPRWPPGAPGSSAAAPTTTCSWSTCARSTRT